MFFRSPIVRFFNRILNRFDIRFGFAGPLESGRDLYGQYLRSLVIVSAGGSLPADDGNSFANVRLCVDERGR